jgi:hypothetical protein
MEFEFRVRENECSSSNLELLSAIFEFPIVIVIGYLYNFLSLLLTW